MTHDELQAVLKLHQQWLNGEEAGERADLRGADLRGAYLIGAYLIGAYLIGADLSGADLSDADLSGAYLRGADLSDADLRGADLSGAKGLPEDRDLLRRVCEAALRPGALNMNAWHTCDTTHCLAGWATHLAGHGGVVLESLYGPQVAGSLLIPAASHMFHASNDAARAWCEETLKRMESEGQQATTPKE